MLVEDHEVVRDGLRALLKTQADIEIVGEVSDGKAAVALAQKLSPDVVVMDVSMPELNGLDATRQILRKASNTKVLVLSSYDNIECVEELMHAGAKGFLNKRSAANQLVEAIRSVRMNSTFYSPEIVKRFKDRQAALSREGRQEGNPFTLTSRQEEVLQLICEGLRNKAVAERLGISIKTVEKHRQETMNKLNIHDIAGLTRYAISRGMLSEKVGIQKVGEDSAVPHTSI